MLTLSCATHFLAGEDNDSTGRNLFVLVVNSCRRNVQRSTDQLARLVWVGKLGLLYNVKKRNAGADNPLKCTA